MSKKGFYEYVMHEYALAEGYYKIACNGDLAISCDNLATLYLNGDKTHKSKPLKALPYYIKACTLDNGYGCLMSGNLKSERIYTLKDLNDTIGGSTYGCVEAGKLSYAISTDITEAKMYYKKACKYGDKEACTKELIEY